MRWAASSPTLDSNSVEHTRSVKRIVTSADVVSLMSSPPTFRPSERRSPTVTPAGIATLAGLPPGTTRCSTDGAPQVGNPVKIPIVVAHDQGVRRLAGDGTSMAHAAPSSGIHRSQHTPPDLRQRLHGTY